MNQVLKGNEPIFRADMHLQKILHIAHAQKMTIIDTIVA